MGVLLVGNAGPVERLAQRRRLRVGAVQHGEVSERSARLRAGSGAAAVDREKGVAPDHVLDRLHHQLGLGPLRGRDLDGDALVHVAHDFGDRLVRSRCNDLRGGADDGAGRAIVARKAYGPDRRVILPKAVEAGRIGATKAVDRLVGVADRAQVAVGRRQQGQQPVLLLVDILEFVDRDPPPAAAIELGDVRIRHQDADRKRDEIVEVDPVAQRHRAGIGRPRLRRLGASPALRALLPGDRAQQPLGLVRAELRASRRAVRCARPRPRRERP